MSYCLNCGYDSGNHYTWCDEYVPRVVYHNTTPRARNTDPDTSHQAAQRLLRNSVTALQFAVGIALENEGPMTDEQLCQHLAETHTDLVTVSGVRTRRSELVNMGFVYDTGERRPTVTGRQAIVWGLRQ